MNTTTFCIACETEIFGEHFLSHMESLHVGGNNYENQIKIACADCNFQSPFQRIDALIQHCKKAGHQIGEIRASSLQHFLSLEQARIEAIANMSGLTASNKPKFNEQKIDETVEEEEHDLNISETETIQAPEPTKFIPMTKSRSKPRDESKNRLCHICQKQVQIDAASNGIPSSVMNHALQHQPSLKPFSCSKCPNFFTTTQRRFLIHTRTTRGIKQGCSVKEMKMSDDRRTKLYNLASTAFPEIQWEKFIQKGKRFACFQL